MVESNRNDEPRALTEEFVKRIDALTQSPQQRAGIVWNILNSSHNKLSNWDLICFSVEILGLMSSEFPWLKEAAMMVSKIVHKAHYLNHDRIIDSEHEIVGGSGSGSGMNVPKMTGE
ncbi:MAG TPA: hypothetical protein ENI23_04510 [bacterium]|nr:hypothetical protein [bacterium]